MTNLDWILKSRGIPLPTKELSSQSYSFSSSHVWMWELDYKESWVPKNWCFWIAVLEKTLEGPLYCKEIQPVHPKGISSEYSLEGLMLKLKLQFFGPWCEELIQWKRPWCWERLKTGGEGDDTGWDGWMASPTQWTWVWASSRSWWWTGNPGMLQSMVLQRGKHDWANWTELNGNKRKQNKILWCSCLVAKSYWTLWWLMDYNTPGSSVHRISQAWIPEVSCHFLLTGIFLTQGMSSCLLHYQMGSLPVSLQGNLFCDVEQIKDSSAVYVKEWKRSCSVNSEVNVTQSCLTPWTVSCQAPLSMEFSRPEYWSG